MPKICIFPIYIATINSTLRSPLVCSNLGLQVPATCSNNMIYKFVCRSGVQTNPLKLDQSVNTCLTEASSICKKIIYSIYTKLNSFK